MNRTKVIELAKQVGLLHEDEDFPLSNRPHQRLISRLERFATLVEREKEASMIERIEQIQGD